MSLVRTVLLGTETLVGRELLERLDARSARGLEVVLAEPGGSHVSLVTSGRQLRVATPLLDEALDGAGAIVVCAALSADEADVVRAASSAAVVLDLAGALDGRAVDGLTGGTWTALGPGLYSSPSAAALLLAELVRATRAAGGAAQSAVVLAPASDLGQVALDELVEQAVSVLNFSAIPQAVFGRQAVHDVASPGPFGDGAEATLRRAVAELAGEPAPAVLLAHAGTFHGVAMAVHATADAGRLGEVLARSPRLLVGEEAAPLATPLSCIQAPKAVVGRVVGDGAGGVWIWAAADTLSHGSVGNAVAVIARQFTGETP